MIRVNAIPNSSAAKKYYDASDYHLEGQEEIAHWHGKGAEMLGLTGPITREAFELLCENRHPQTGKQLTAKHIANRRVGYDFTFSVPKSVSLAYALGGDERITDVFREAVAETMNEMEREMQVRVRRGGADHDTPSRNFIWADFLHKTTRPIGGQPDPHLHIHAVVFNATWDQEGGNWKAGQFGGLKADAPYFQASFRTKLANKLQSLGYDIRRTKDDFELLVPERTIKAFSRRTKQINDLVPVVEAELSEKYDREVRLGPVGKAKLGATSREKKVHGLTWEDLLERWEARLRPGEKEAIDRLVAEAARNRLPEMTNRAALDWAIEHEFERNSAIEERQLVTTALKHGLGRVTVPGVWEELARHKDLIRRNVDGKAIVTTRQVFDEEKTIAAFAIAGRGKHKPLGKQGAKVPATLVPGEAKPPTPTQAAAMRHIWTSPDRVILVRGLAGVGKTETLAATLAQLAVPYVALAPSAQASRGELREKGVAGADTLAKFLLDEKMQAKAKNGLIVLDEASLTGAKDMGRLVQLADRLNARIVLSGDRKQHKAVARGDVLALLEDRAGLPVVEVSEIKRQAGRYKDVVEHLARGDVAAGFEVLDHLGWVQEVKPDEIAARIADDYLAAMNYGRSVLVVSPTHAQAEGVTAAIRQKLKEKELIRGEENTFERLVPLHRTEAERTEASLYADGDVVQFIRSFGRFKAGERVQVTRDNVHDVARAGRQVGVYRPDTVRLAAGDSVRITATGWDETGDHRLNNGAVYTVKGFTPDGGIRLNNDWVLDKSFGFLDHGYVSTSHASQGRNVDRVLVAMGAESFGAAGKEQFYVSVSRGKQRATIYTEDKERLAEAIEHEDNRLLAHDVVRLPKGKLRQKMKRFLAFMRSTVSMGNVMDRNRLKRQQEKEISYGR